MINQKIILSYLKNSLGSRVTEVVNFGSTEQFIRVTYKVKYDNFPYTTKVRLKDVESHLSDYRDRIINTILDD